MDANRLSNLEWVGKMLAGLGLLYDDVLGILNEAAARFPLAVDAIDYVAGWLKEKVGHLVADPDALARLLWAQFLGGGSDPDSGSDV